ncbi:cold shock protein 1-like [Helianthus annuus]|uniref:cold shock protein 1-like n=1 Tax=Helianthus annuus TaxID=4232 RepID=UPI001652D05F|nr:cold shock protein 1-like [Helianthus annuus]
MGETAAHALTWDELKELMQFKGIECFIWGLAPQILSKVTASKPPTITDAIDLSVALIEEAVRLGKFSISEEKKETHVEPSRDNKRKYGKCDNCGKVGHVKETCWHDTGRGNGGQDGSGNRGGNNDNNHQGGNGNDQGHGQGCFNCGDIGHFKKYCPKNNQARGRVSNIGAREAR